MTTDDPDDFEVPDDLAAFEAKEPRPAFDVLAEAGVSLPRPEEFDDAQLKAKLWEVINTLALLGAFLHNTNHLSDRQLYTELWEDLLREPLVLLPEVPSYSCHLDLVGSGSEEHTFLYLKHYADERERRSWLQDWPSDRMPDHEDPPYDRDGRLPKPGSRRGGPAM